MPGGGEKGEGHSRAPAHLILAHVLRRQGMDSSAQHVPASSVTVSWVQNPRGGGTRSSHTNEGVSPCLCRCQAGVLCEPCVHPS